MVRRRSHSRRRFLQALAGIGLTRLLSGGNARAGRGAPGVQLGAGASLGGKRVFPPDNPWNEDISQKPVDPNSDTLIQSIGASKLLHPDFGRAARNGKIGIPYVVVPGNQPKVPIQFEYKDESDRGPYPIPPEAPIEGGANSDSDRHVLVIDRDTWKLYELFLARPDGKGWSAVSGAVFNLSTNRLRTMGWTSADAAGLPVFPGLARADEVFEQQVILHALRFTCKRTRRAYVFPARHFASKNTDENLPPMGMRVRLRAGYNLAGFSPEARVILTALKKYGMFLADNGSDWYLSGAPDPRWSDANLNQLKAVRGRDFEVVLMEKISTR